MILLGVCSLKLSSWIKKLGAVADASIGKVELKKWQPVGKGSVDMGKEHYISLGACNWGGTGAVTVEFDYFRSNPPIIMAVASPSGKLATTWGRLRMTMLKCLMMTLWM